MSNRNSKKNQELYANFPRLFPELAPVRSYPKNNQNTSLREETLCPCPPETVEPALDTVDGGIFNLVKNIKEIKRDLDLINAGAFDASLLTDEQHYALLEIDLALESFLAPYSYLENLK